MDLFLKICNLIYDKIKSLDASRLFTNYQSTTAVFNSFLIIVDIPLEINKAFQKNAALLLHTAVLVHDFITMLTFSNRNNRFYLNIVSIFLMGKGQALLKQICTMLQTALFHLPERFIKVPDIIS